MNTQSTPKASANRILALLYSLLLGCTTMAASAKGLPAWVESPPADSASHYFGIGQGKSIANATQSALESVAGKLMTEVESDLTIATQVQDNVAKSEVASQIRSQVAKTNLANYSVEATEKDGKDYFILIKVEKAAVLQANQDALKELMSELNAYFTRLDERGSLAVKDDAKGVGEKIRQARSKALISRSLNPNYDHTGISNTLRSYENKLSQKVANQTIYISSSPALKNLAQKIANQLTNEGYTVTLNKPTQPAPTIHLNGNFREFEQFQQKHVAANAAVRVTDEFNKALYTSEVVLSGASMMSYDSAKTIAVNRYIKELEVYGAATSFGLADE